MKNYFIQIKKFLDTDVFPMSNSLDYDENLLKKIYDELIKLGTLKFLIPKEFGGLGGERSEWIEYNILMAQYSGALLFLQAQHQFAISQLKKLNPEKNIIDLFRMVVQDNMGLGISLAANRKLLKVVKMKDGFELSGKLPWVTGYSYFQSILLSFDIDNKAYYFVLPFNSSLKNKAIAISQKIETAVFDATNTVSIILDKYFIPNNEILATQDIQPKKITEHPAIYNFAGAAKSLLEISSHGKYNHCKLSRKNHALLLNEWDTYYKEILKNQSCPLELRAKGLSLAEKCASFARIVCGAESILVSHSINRISREIWQYTVAGYSEDQLNAYLLFPSEFCI